MTALTKEQRASLDWVAGSTPGLAVTVDGDHLRAALSHIDALEAERDAALARAAAAEQLAEDAKSEAIGEEARAERAEARWLSLAEECREAELRGIKQGAAMARDMLSELMSPVYVGQPTFVERVVARLTPASSAGALS